MIVVVLMIRTALEENESWKWKIDRNDKWAFLAQVYDHTKTGSNRIENRENENWLFNKNRKLNSSAQAK